MKKVLNVYSILASSSKFSYTLISTTMKKKPIIIIIQNFKQVSSSFILWNIEKKKCLNIKNVYKHPRGNNCASCVPIYIQIYSLSEPNVVCIWNVAKKKWTRKSHKFLITTHDMYTHINFSIILLSTSIRVRVAGRYFPSGRLLDTMWIIWKYILKIQSIDCVVAWLEQATPHTSKIYVFRVGTYGVTWW